MLPPCPNPCLKLLKEIIKQVTLSRLRLSIAFFKTESTPSLLTVWIDSVCELAALALLPQELEAAVVLVE